MRTIAVLLAAAGALGAADDSVLERLIPPEADTVMGVNIARIRTSPLWPLLLESADPERRGFRDLRYHDRLDLSRDLDEVIVTGRMWERLVILRASVDPDGAAALGRIGQDFEAVAHLGAPVLRPPEGRAGGVCVAMPAGYIVIGPAALVKQAIERLQRPSPPSAVPARFLALRGNGDAWYVSLGPPGIALNQDVELPDWEMTTLRIHLGSDVRIEGSAVMRNRAAAERMWTIARAALLEFTAHLDVPYDRPSFSLDGASLRAHLTMTREELKNVILQQW